MANINVNPTTSESQNARIYEWMKAGNRISPILALRKFGSFRLGARIADIREKYNVAIESHFIVTPSGKRVKEYWIPKEA